MKYNQMRQVVFPILAAFIWGTAFVAQDLCADSIGAFAFNATRYFIAVLALLVVILISDKLKKNKPTLTAQEKKAANKQLWLGGLCCGAALAIASNFQQAGLVAGTDGGKAGFITALYVVLLLFLQRKVNPDFYEDVLKATEISQTAITAKKEGKLNDSLPQNVKLGKTGLGSGKDAFFLKHRLEDRRSGFFLFDRMALIMAAMTFLFTFFLKDSGMISIFAFATYLQIFTALTGRWVKELTLPYVYLIPQPPFRKLLSICKENLVKILADAVLVMVPVGLILKAGPIVILTAVLARTSFGVLFMSGNILTERIFGSVTNKGLLVGLYILTMMLLAAPGGILGIVIGAILSSSEFALPAGLAVSALWNLLIAALVAFCCRGLLNCAELNNR